MMCSARCVVNLCGFHYFWHARQAFNSQTSSGSGSFERNLLTFCFPIFTALCHQRLYMSLLLSSLQEAVINELKCKTRLVQEKKLLQQDEVYNGALEDILLGLKSEPYRRADAVRRSQRRRIDNNRLSRTMEELEF